MANNRTFKVYIETNSEQRKLFENASKAYSLSYKNAMNAQIRWMIETVTTPENFCIPLKTLLKFCRSERHYNELLWNVPVDICEEAISYARDHFKNKVFQKSDKKWFYYTPREDYLHFYIRGNYYVEDNSFELPYVGRVTFSEKGFLPEGGLMGSLKIACDNLIKKKWYLTCEWVDQPKKPEPVALGDLKTIPLMLDFNKEGYLILNNDPSKKASLRNLESYLKLDLEVNKRRTKILSARQTGKSKELIQKMQKNLDKLKRKLENIRKDNFRKTASMIVDMGYEAVLIPSEKCVKKKRKNFNSGMQKKCHCLEFYKLLLRKFEQSGILIIFHEDGDDFNRKFMKYIDIPRKIEQQKISKQNKEKAKKKSKQKGGDILASNEVQEMLAAALKNNS